MNFWRSSLWAVVATLIFIVNPRAAAQEEQKFTPVQIDYFENKVRPILVEHCLACHGDDKDKLRGGLYLTSHDAMLRGGDSGPAIVPGDPENSLLIQSVHYEDYEMPPSGQLAPELIQILEKWIEMGAPDPRDEDGRVTAVHSIDLDAGRKFWAFQPLATGNIELNQNDSWSRSPIDRLIRARHHDANLTPVADADRLVLVRRAYLTLTGLPPTAEQISQFESDPQDTEIAFSNLVDRLLESPHFGERWGRHWLDVVRFAESSGGGRSLMFPHAWRFRDYVIDAFNVDKPFDQFIREQIAGDLLPYESHDQKIEQIVATGMLALGPTNYEQQDKELLRMEVIDEQVDTVGRAFMGLTLGCARCHDHKFDPIPMTDYYALAGIFGGTQSLVDGNVSSYVTQPLATESELKAMQVYREQVEQLAGQLAAAQKRLEQLGGKAEVGAAQVKSVDSSSLPGIILDDRDANLTGQWKESQFKANFVDGRYLHDKNEGKGKKQAVFTPRLETGGRYEVRLSYTASGNRASNVPVTIDHQDGKTRVLVNQSQQPPIDGLFVSLGTWRFEADNQSQITISTEDTDGHVIVDAIQLLHVSEQTDALKTTGNDETAAVSKPTSDRAANDSEESPALKLLRKEIADLDSRLKKLKKNAPRPLDVAMSVKDAKDPKDGHLYIRGSVRHPGPVVPRGLISVCCDDPPTLQLEKHQSGRLQLANWIASPKHPLTARVYVNRVWRHLFGQGLVATPDNFGDMGSRPSHPELLDYLAHQFIQDGWSTKKLIRRIMNSRVYQLSSLDDERNAAADPENRLYWRVNRRRVDAEVLRDSILSVSGELDRAAGGQTIRKITQYDLGYEFDTVRRSVYVPAFRNSMLDLFEVFDAANPNLVTGHRNTSTLPTQALYLMNSPFVMEQSRKTATRWLAQESLDEKQRIDLAFRSTLGRPATAAEERLTIQHLRKIGSDETNAEKRLEAWTSVCHSLFASLDFRYME